MSELAPARRRWFLLGLGMATLLPLTTQTAARLLDLKVLGDVNVTLAFLASGFHVALTSFFYLEPDLAELRRLHRGRFVWAPLGLALGTAALTLWLHGDIAWVLAGYFAWQLYHYQRQNFGVMAFVASSQKVARPTTLEQVALEVAGYAGILGFFALDGFATPRKVGAFAAALHQVGLSTQIAAVLLSLVAMVLRLKREGWSWYPLWHLLCSGFFAGTFILPDIGLAFATYAYAHGLQYLVFMYSLSMARGATVPKLSPIALTFMGLAGSILLMVLGDRTMFSWSKDGLFGAYLGLVMAHFVVDASVWRLGEPTQRAYVRKAFSFIWE